jgi:hydrogen cyanide synthase HcnC
MSETFDAIVIGGGLMGSAIGYGLAQKGLKCVILDEGDVAYRAARGNFGLVWVQSKGIGAPPYADWTMRSANLWGGFAGELRERTGIDVAHEQPGGIEICLSEQEFEERAAKMATLAGHQGGRFTHEMLDRKQMLDYVPGLGPDVVGGSFTPHDGHANPLRLMRAMQRGFVDLGGEIRTDSHALELAAGGGGNVRVTTRGQTFEAARVVLAAGLGNRDLAPMAGLDQPVRPVKGQIIVTERVRRFLNMPTTNVRQTNEGTVLVGASQEEAGFDLRASVRVSRTIAARSWRAFPFLGRARVIRTWAALRVMTPDGLPIYDRSETMPGVFAASCHSGVTLAAAHAGIYAGYVADGKLGDELAPLSAGRFDV